MAFAVFAAGAGRTPPADGAGVDCPPPPAVAAGAAPLQTPVPRGMAAVALQAGTLTPLAGFSVEARVLSRRDYRLGREAALSPTDLALGWGRMREDAVLSQLSISQSSRWYHDRWQRDPPLPPAEIVRSSANTHMIPSSADVATELRRVRRDDHVRIGGWLVRIDAPDGWRWISSLERDDSGAGACEVVYVCRIERQQGGSRRAIAILTASLPAILETLGINATRNFAMEDRDPPYASMPIGQLSPVPPRPQ